METSPLLSESLCCRWVFGLAHELGSRKVIMEIDDLLLYQTWKSRLDSPSYLSSIEQDCLSMETNFDSYKLVHVKRQCNAVAYFLTRKSFTTLRHVWLEDYPPDLIPFLVYDESSFIPDY